MLRFPGEDDKISLAKVSISEMTLKKLLDFKNFKRPSESYVVLRSCC